MASKVMVKMPINVVTFGQVNKSKNNNVNGDIVLSRSPERPLAKNGSDQTQKSPEQVRICQLEHNVKFLQEQHQLMLNGLHIEVECLKTRNRELQFQLVFARSPLSINSPSNPSSPEDEVKHKIYNSPKSPNCTPLQVELLEKELGEIKLQMGEIENRNAYLAAIVDEQKKKLERYERDREKEQKQWATQVEEAELLRKLEEAEMLIRRLRRENSDLRREAVQQVAGMRRENAQPQQAHNSGNCGQAQYNNGYQHARTHAQGNRGGSSRHRSGNNGQHYNNRGGWFPALHSQSFWQGGRQNERPAQSNSQQQESTNLPSLQHQISEPSGSNGYKDQYYHGKRGSNNNHYRGEGGRTFRNAGGHKNGKSAS